LIALRVVDVDIPPGRRGEDRGIVAAGSNGIVQLCGGAPAHSPERRPGIDEPTVEKSRTVGGDKGRQVALVHQPAEPFGFGALAVGLNHGARAFLDAGEALRLEMANERGLARARTPGQDEAVGLVEHSIWPRQTRLGVTPAGSP
jgi:hypothetical protein